MTISDSLCNTRILRTLLFYLFVVFVTIINRNNRQYSTTPHYISVEIRVVQGLNTLPKDVPLESFLLYILQKPELTYHQFPAI